MVAISTGFISILVAIFQIFTSFNGMSKLDGIDLDNYKMEITRSYTIKSGDSEDYHEKAQTFGLVDGDKSNYKFQLISNDKNVNLDSYYDKNSTYFNTEAVKDLAGDRASNSLKKLKNDYIKIDGIEAFGFEMKYNLNLIDESLKLFKDEEFNDIMVRLVKFLEEEGLINSDSKNYIELSVEDLYKYNSLYEKINERSDIKKDIVKLVNIIMKDETFTLKELDSILKTPKDEESKSFLKMFKGTNFKFKSNDEDSIDIDVDFNIFIGDDKDKISIDGDINLLLYSTDEKVKLPEKYEEVSNKDYHRFFLSTYDDIALINIEGDLNKEISYVNKLLLHENSVYVDEHVIKQLAKEEEKNVYKRGDKSIKLEDDNIVTESGIIKAFQKDDINYYPLRKIAQDLGYEVEYEDFEISPRFQITLK